MRQTSTFRRRLTINGPYLQTGAMIAVRKRRKKTRITLCRVNSKCRSFSFDDALNATCNDFLTSSDVVACLGLERGDGVCTELELT